PGRQPAEVRRVHPRHQTRATDRAVPRPCPVAPDPARRALPGRDRRAAGVPDPVPTLPASHTDLPRRHIAPDHRRRRARHDETDGVPDDDALLRRVPEVAAVNVLLLGPQGSGKGTQAKLISKTYGIPQDATGDMIREIKELDTDLG